MSYCKRVSFYLSCGVHDFDRTDLSVNLKVVLPVSILDSRIVPKNMGKWNNFELSYAYVVNCTSLEIGCALV